MLNKTVSEVHSNVDFMKFIHSNFMNEVNDKGFPIKFRMRKKSKEDIESLTKGNPSVVKNILERQLIRDNIYFRYKIDILENPIVVFYEDGEIKKMKPFIKYDEAKKFSESILNEGIFSMLILIMNSEIECEIFKD